MVCTIYRYLVDMAYSGRYIPKNKEKYSGDANNITYRSLWERKCMEFFDLNPDVVKWQSEETIVPYICRTDGRPHRYFMDFQVTFKNNVTLLIEVKPESQTRPPTSKNKARMINEAMTYAKNISKWEAAELYAKKRGWVFQIWTEKTLDRIGIKTNRKR